MTLKARSAKLRARINQHRVCDHETARKIGKALNRLGHTLQITLGAIEVFTHMVSPASYLFIMLGIALLQWFGTELMEFWS